MLRQHKTWHLVTDDGVVVAGARWHVRALCKKLDDAAFIAYAVRNLGAAAVRDRGDVVEVRWRAEGLTQATAAGLVQWLVQLPPRRVLLARLSGGRFEHTLFPSSSVAINAVLDAHAEANRRSRRFFSARKRIDEAALYPAFDAALRFVAACRGVLDHESGPVLGDTILRGRYVVLRQSGDRLLLDQIGKGYHSIDPRWRSMGRGFTLEHQPDSEYGRWVEGAYREARNSSLAVADDVDAEVELSRDRFIRLRYRRLILPVVGTGGEKLVLGTSQVDPTVVIAT